MIENLSPATKPAVSLSVAMRQERNREQEWVRSRHRELRAEAYARTFTPKWGVEMFPEKVA